MRAKVAEVLERKSTIIVGRIIVLLLILVALVGSTGICVQGGMR